MKCPKCQYERSATDEAPDWQCPNCGVAYIKVTPEALAAAREARAGFSAKSTSLPGRGKSNGWSMVLAGACLAAIVFGVWKIKVTAENRKLETQATQSESKKFDDARKAMDSGDFETAIQGFTPLAKAGNPLAQYYLGRIYQFDSWRPDAGEGINWYIKSAEQGEVLAQVALGKIYEGGTSTPVDLEKSLDWYRKAADQGDPYAKDRIPYLERKPQLAAVEPIKTYNCVNQFGTVINSTVRCSELDITIPATSVRRSRMDTAGSAQAGLKADGADSAQAGLPDWKAQEEAFKKRAKARAEAAEQEERQAAIVASNQSRQLKSDRLLVAECESYRGSKCSSPENMARMRRENTPSTLAEQQAAGAERRRNEMDRQFNQAARR